MNMSLGLIKYYWESGSFSLKDMMLLVQKEIISQEDFFDITRLSYKGCMKDAAGAVKED